MLVIQHHVSSMKPNMDEFIIKFSVIEIKEVESIKIDKILEELLLCCISALLDKLLYSTPRTWDRRNRLSKCHSLNFPIVYKEHLIKNKRWWSVEVRYK